MYGKETCPFCAQVKQLLNNEKIPFEYKDYQEHKEEASKLTEQFRPGFNTVPRVFIERNGAYTFIGGYNDTKKYLHG